MPICQRRAARTVAGMSSWIGSEKKWPGVLASRLDKLRAKPTSKRTPNPTTRRHRSPGDHVQADAQAASS